MILFTCLIIAEKAGTLPKLPLVRPAVIKFLRECGSSTTRVPESTSLPSHIAANSLLIRSIATHMPYQERIAWSPYLRPLPRCSPNAAHML